VPASEHAFEIRYGPDQASPDWPYDDDPRLALQVRGPAGEPVSISGLIDSGAITTALPLEMAEELGYRDRDLFYMRVTVPGGSVGVWKARLPCRAVVPELENLPFELCPYFVPQLNEALWGRADFFVAFDVVFEHGEGRVLLTPRVAEHPLASMAVTAR
jgi:hypothetical protein